LKGSSDIANTYYDANAKVFGVFQADMTAYVAPGKPQKINIIADYVNEDLTDFLKVSTADGVGDSRESSD
jgi:hypothetical protein